MDTSKITTGTMIALIIGLVIGFALGAYTYRNDGTADEATEPGEMMDGKDVATGSVSATAPRPTGSVSQDLSSRGAKDLLTILYREGGDATGTAKKHKLLQKSDTKELEKIVEKIIKENKGVVDEYKSGNDKVVQFLIGQGMQATKGSANPGILNKLFTEMLGK